MAEQFENDPRSDALTAGSSLPCGEKECRPECEVCLFKDKPTPDLRVALCGKLLLAQVAGKLFHEVTELEQQVNTLTSDPLTNLLTPAGRDMIIGEFEEQGALRAMADGGWSLISIYMDMNKLKQFNELGDDNGGDMALRTMGGIISKVFRSNGDNITHLPGPRHISDLRIISRSALEAGKPFNILSRKGGDEMTGYVFVPPGEMRGGQELPGQTDRRQHDLVNYYGRRLCDALNNTRLVFDKKSDISSNSMMNDNLSLEYRDLPGGQVEVRMSAIVSLAMSPMPHNASQIDKLTDLIDSELKIVKRDRDCLSTMLRIKRIADLAELDN